MRALLFALALGACAQARCDLSESHTVSFTSGSERDTITASAAGDDCASAQLTLQVRTADGETIFSQTMPAAAMVQSITARPAARDVQAFLAAWSNPTVSYTALAPPWRALEPDANVTLDQSSYAAVRAQQWRTICPAVSPDRAACLYWDPEAREVMRLYDRASAAE